MADSSELRILNGVKPPDSAAESANDLAKKLQKTMLRLKGDFMTGEGRGVNYTELAKSDVFQEYKTQTALLHNVSLETLSQNQLKAFFINIYNALTIHGLSEELVLPDSVLKVNQFWKTTAYRIAGLVFTLDDIEHGVLRGNRAHPASIDPQFGPKDPRLKYTMLTPDPRIHFALVCGAKSCPAIQVYTEDNLERALEGACRNFCKQEVSMFTESNEIWLSKLFQWYREDFGKIDTDVIRWVIPHLEPGIQDRANILLLKLETQGTVAVKFNEYDWSLNKS
ncbi:uncharacterized protein LOC124121721 [Haliotis rufescens]|uniref:uncharacterized protein LOC124121721 n=1 Tax=Haliotis rufescens TaxID=6454 RepID=UPI001EAFF15A|nr:uncharacterized protein LOC124121721 [Haliotis rufescens]